MAFEWGLNSSKFVCNSEDNAIEFKSKTGEKSDCCFLVGGNVETQKKFLAHKSILKVASPVFEAMFFGSLAEKGDSPINLPDINEEAFEVLLKFIYGAYYSIWSIQLAQNVYIAADKYLIETLKTQCHNYLKSQMSYATVSSIYDFAVFVDNKELLELAVKLFKDATCQVACEKNFPNVSLSTFMAILELNFVTINDEMELFKLLTEYAFYHLHKQGFDDEAFEENSDLKDELRELVKKIQFLKFSPGDFYGTTGLSKLITFEESSAIYECLIDRNKVKELYPAGFTQEAGRVHRQCHGRIRCQHCKRDFNCTRPRKPNT